MPPRRIVIDTVARNCGLLKPQTAVVRQELLLVFRVGVAADLTLAPPVLLLGLHQPDQLARLRAKAVPLLRAPRVAPRQVAAIDHRAARAELHQADLLLHLHEAR